MIFHNPDNLRPEQVDPNSEGWRLLTVEELDNPPGDREHFFLTQWRFSLETSGVRSHQFTYRTKAPLPDKDKVSATPVNDGGPAFPQTVDSWFGKDGNVPAPSGMTLRQYAAIKLRVPNSGTPWLDEMICENRRMDLAGQALAGLVIDGVTPVDVVVGEAWRLADAMLEARKGGAK